MTLLPGLWMTQRRFAWTLARPRPGLATWPATQRVAALALLRHDPAARRSSPKPWPPKTRPSPTPPHPSHACAPSAAPSPPSARHPQHPLGRARRLRRRRPLLRFSRRAATRPPTPIPALPSHPATIARDGAGRARPDGPRTMKALLEPWRTRLLWLSLGLNLFAAAALVAPHLWPPPPPGPPSFSTCSSTAWPRPPAPRRRRLPRRHGPGTTRYDIAANASTEARATSPARIATHPYDPAAAATALAAMQDRLRESSARFDDSLVASLGTLSPEGRARLCRKPLRRAMRSTAAPSSSAPPPSPAAPSAPTTNAPPSTSPPPSAPPPTPPQAAWPAPDWWRNFHSPELDALIERARAYNNDLARRRRPRHPGRRPGPHQRRPPAAHRHRHRQLQLRTTSAPAAAGGTTASAAFTHRGTPAGTLTHSISRTYSRRPLRRQLRRRFLGQEPRRPRSRPGLRPLQPLRPGERRPRPSSPPSPPPTSTSSPRQDRLARRRNATSRDAAARPSAPSSARLEVGTANALDVAQQEALVAGQRAAIPQLQTIEQQVIALGILVGTPARAHRPSRRTRWPACPSPHRPRPAQRTPGPPPGRRQRRGPARRRRTPTSAPPAPRSSRPSSPARAASPAPPSPP